MTDSMSGPSKISVILHARGGVCFCCVLNKIKVAQRNAPLVDRNLYAPFAFARAPTYPLVTANRIASRSRVHGVLAARRRAQIFAAVIQPVTVAVVDHQMVGRTHYDAMKQKAFTALLAAAWPVANAINSVPYDAGRPIKPIHQGSIGCVDNGFISPRQHNVGNIAFNPDRAYLFRHVATSIAAWAGRGRDTSRPVYLERNRDKAQGVLN